MTYTVRLYTDSCVGVQAGLQGHWPPTGRLSGGVSSHRGRYLGCLQGIASIRHGLGWLEGKPKLFAVPQNCSSVTYAALLSELETASTKFAIGSLCRRWLCRQDYN